MGDANQDPSMEEILASIKRVIAEDGRSPDVVPRAQHGRLAEVDAMDDEFDQADSDDVLELDNSLAEAEDGLLSPDTAAASRQSLAALAALHTQDEPVHGTGGQGPLEAVVREMLRPMLKSWLEQRLPEMVEEMVSREIARITGKSL
jgi:cell pole-organizing protein PopZ